MIIFTPNSVIKSSDVNANNNDLQTQLDNIKASWTDFGSSISFTGVTVGNGQITAKYIKIGKTVHGYVDFVAGSTTTFSGSAIFRFSPPVAFPTIAGVAYRRSIGVVYIEDYLVTGYVGHLFYDETSNYINPRIARGDGTYTSLSDLSTTVPFTFGNQDYISMQFTYEAA